MNQPKIGIIAKLLKRYSNVIFRKIRKTPPMKCNGKATTKLLSLVGHKHLNIYMLSIKSFLRFYDDVGVVLIDDGSLTQNDFELLRYHIKNIVIISNEDAEHKIESCLNSRILFKLRRKDISLRKLIDINLIYNDDSKKILVDSDVLFLDYPDEIIGWIKEGTKPFYHTRKLKSDEINIPKKLSATPPPNANIQYYFRKNLTKINEELGTNIKNLEYCSGFIGYLGYIKIEKIEKVIKALLNYSPPGFPSWGIEQNAYAFCLRDQSDRLDDRYYFASTKIQVTEKEAEQAKFIHFIGKARQKQYRKQGKRIISQLINNSTATI